MHDSFGFSASIATHWFCNLLVAARGVCVCERSMRFERSLDDADKKCTYLTVVRADAARETATKMENNHYNSS